MRIYVSFPLEDGDEVDSKVRPRVREVARFVADLIRERPRVLVDCTEGLNRSGLVAARALMEVGLNASAAIELVRKASRAERGWLSGAREPRFVERLLAEARPGA